MKVKIILGDIHGPYEDQACLKEAQGHYKFYKRQKSVDVSVIQVGDIIDGKAWSRYPKNPDDENPQLEWDKTEESMEFVQSLFPEMTILIGNHDVRPMKKALEAGTPKQLIKSIDQIFDYEGWHWHLSNVPYEEDGVCFIHGDELAGNAWQKAQKMGKSVVQGHDHQGYLHYINTFGKSIFGMSVGCMIDEKAIAFRYAAKNPFRCWKGFGLMVDGVPSLVPYT